MRHLWIPGLLASAFAVLPIGTAEAQIFNNPTRTYGVGSSTGPGPRWSGLGLGVFPLNYRGSPGQAEGTYTAPDHRMFNIAPSFGMTLGWFSKRSPSPRPEPNLQFNPPVGGASTAEPPLYVAPEPMTPAATPMPAPATAPATPPMPAPTIAPAPEPIAAPAPEPIAAPKANLMVEVRVPVEGAQVFVNNQPTKQSGLVRMFASPPLANGERYQYEIRVEWSANDKQHAVKQTLIGKPGEKLVADFSK